MSGHEIDDNLSQEEACYDDSARCDLYRKILAAWEKLARENLPACPQVSNALAGRDIGTRHFELRGFISGEIKSLRDASFARRQACPRASDTAPIELPPSHALMMALGVDPHGPNFTPLFGAVIGCLEQVVRGKGRERHARGRDFIDQPIMVLPRLLGGDVGLGGLIFQALKKTEEAVGLPHDRRLAELRGAVIYLLAAIMHEEASAQTTAIG